MSISQTFEDEVDAWLYLECHSALSAIEQKAFLKTAHEMILSVEFFNTAIHSSDSIACQENLQKLRRARTMAQLYEHLSSPHNHLYVAHPEMINKMLIAAHQAAREKAVIRV